MSRYTNKTDILSLVQDEVFIRLVVGAENPEELLAELQKENPDQSDDFEYAFEFIRVNHANKIKMRHDDYNQVLNNIKLHLEKKSQSRLSRLFPLPFRVAASILVILSVSSIVVYKQLEKDPLTKFAQMQHEGEKQALIILSNGTTKVLKNNDSFIDYTSAEGEVVVKNTKEEERIINRNTEENSVLNQVVVPYGQRQNVVLNDGTTVQLNAGSKLVFPAKFSGKTREVFLVGEAFFEVTKNMKMPFIVKSNHVDIKVLGTRFNVSAYDDEYFVTTVLVEGKVNVSQKDKLFGNAQYNLLPGQGCFYSENSKTSVVKSVDLSEYISWKDGIYQFKDLSLADVVSRVKKYYNIPIKIENEKLASTLISGKLFLSEDFGEVLQFLSKTIEGRYDELENDIYILKQ